MKKSEWEFGTCNNIHARRHKKKGNVQMILHEAGHAGHQEDYWHNFDSSWWPQFEPYPPVYDELESEEYAVFLEAPRFTRGCAWSVAVIVTVGLIIYLALTW